MSAIAETDVASVDSATASVRGYQRRRRVAVALAAVGFALAVAIVRFGMAGDPRFRLGLDLGSIAPLGATILYPLVGALIIQRRPTTRLAWLMIAMGIGLGIGFAGYGYGTIGQTGRAQLPGAVAAIVASQYAFVPVLATGTTMFFLWFPTDRLIGPRWRWVVALSLVGLIGFLVSTTLNPGDLDHVNFPGLANPFGLPAEWAPLVNIGIALSNAAMLAAAMFGVLSLVLRYRRGDRVERAQIRWIALVGATVAASFSVAALQLGPVSDGAWAIGFGFLACLPIAIGFAITRYRLYEIDRLINRALLYGLLSAILAGIFTAGIGFAQRLFVATTGESSDAAIVITTLVVATLYAPLRKRLESLIDRWFKYEHRRFGAYRDEIGRLLGLLDPARVAQRLVTEAVRELEATGGAVVDADDRAMAIAGQWPVPPVVRLVIPGGDRSLAAILVGPRSDGRLHDPSTVAQLEDTVRLASKAVGLTQTGR